MGVVDRLLSILDPKGVIEIPRDTPPGVIAETRELVNDICNSVNPHEMLAKLRTAADEHKEQERRARARQQFLDKLEISPEHLRMVKITESEGQFIVDIRVPVRASVPSTIVLSQELSDGFSAFIDNSDVVRQAQLSKTGFDPQEAFEGHKGFLLYDVKTRRCAILIPEGGLANSRVLDLGVMQTALRERPGMTMQERTEMSIGVPGAVGQLVFAQSKAESEED